MRFLSWNVNGLRAIVKKGFIDIFYNFDADIFAIQEIKLQQGQIDLELDNYYQYFSYAEKKGYSGTAIFSKKPALSIIDTIGSEELDREGRLLALEFNSFWFVNVYTPNSQNELSRLDHRRKWNQEFLGFCKNLENGIGPNKSRVGKKPVIICGDFNVAHREIDLKNPKTNLESPGFSIQERSDFDDLLQSGFIDTFRFLNPDLTGAYTWWNYRYNARKTNAGWRIDYFLISKSLVEKLQNASIWPEVLGSDHCPISLELDI